MADICIGFGPLVKLRLPKSISAFSWFDHFKSKFKQMGSPLSSIAIESMLSHSEEEGFLKEVGFVGDVETLRKRSSIAKAKVRGWSWSMLVGDVAKQCL